MPPSSASHRIAPKVARLHYPTVKRQRAADAICHRFGLRLCRLRLDRDMTQEQMAKKFGINRSYVSDIERGTTAPSLPMLEVFALGMRMSLAELLEGL